MSTVGTTDPPSATDGALAQLDDILDSLPVAVLVVDTRNRIVLVNREAETLLAYPRRAMLGEPLEMLIPEASRAAHPGHVQGYLEKPVARRMGSGRDLCARRADGSLVPVEIALKPIDHADGLLVIAAIVDIGPRKALERQTLAARAELEDRVRERTAELERSNREKQAMLENLERARAELEHLSRHDPLTGLLNRRAFAERLALESARSARRSSPLCVAMLDLDRFKQVNDDHGHALGDEVLRTVAGILRGQCRAVDLLCRHGGEEFALGLPDTCLAEAIATCERIRGAIESFRWSELAPGLAVTISIGIVAHRPDETGERALARADVLLYAAKRNGRNRVEAAAEGTGP